MNSATNLARITKKTEDLELKDSLREIFDFENLFPPSSDASSLVVVCSPGDYSASIICRAVEDCDAHVLNLNVAGQRTDAGELMVYLRVDRRCAQSVGRSLERFGYESVVLDTDADDESTSSVRNRVNALLRMLDV